MKRKGRNRRQNSGYRDLCNNRNGVFSGAMVVYVIKHEDPAEFQRRADDEEQERYIAEWCEKHKGRKEPLWKRIVGGLKK